MSTRYPTPLLPGHAQTDAENWLAGGDGDRGRSDDARLIVTDARGKMVCKMTAAHLRLLVKWNKRGDKNRQPQTWEPGIHSEANAR